MSSPTGTVADVLAQLLDFRWRVGQPGEVSFPAIEFDVDLEQDLVQHKWPDRDGAHVEATGRAPLVFNCTIPFRNFITPGVSENWDSGATALYPTTFRAFFQAMATRSSGQLQHPEFGLIQCKPWKAKAKWLAQRRDGCDVQASWIESLDDTVSQFQDVMARRSPVPESQVACADLDAQIISYANPAVTSDPDPLTFTQQLQQITSAVDQVTLAQYTSQGLIDHVVYRLVQLQSRLEAANDVTAWPLLASACRAQSAVFDLKTLLLTAQQPVLTYAVPQDTTLAGLTVLVPGGARIDDLLTLNPALVQSPIVPLGTTVRYYRPAA